MVVVLQQEGVFRTSCLDCLDHTNLIQTLISQMAVEAFLGHRGQFAASDFWMRHSSLWADNGDSLSEIYAGTGALKSSFTRHGKMSLSGAVADMRKSVQRICHNNFVDPSRPAGRRCPVPIRQDVGPGQHQERRGQRQEDGPVGHGRQQGRRGHPL